MLLGARLQPNDKPLIVTRTAAQGASSRPYENKTYTDDAGNSWQNESIRANVFSDKPNPIKHWRKQLIPNEASGASMRRVSIPFNAPGSSHTVPVVPTESAKVPVCQVTKARETGNQVPNVLFQNPNKPNLEFYYHPNKSIYNAGKQFSNGPGYSGKLSCKACNPQANLIKPTFGQTTKRINPIAIPGSTVSYSTIPYSFDSGAYLRSRKKSYNTNLNGSLIPGRQYYYHDKCCNAKALPPSSNPHTSTGLRRSLYASYLNKESGGAGNSTRAKCCNIVYKPSNPQFATQGSVSCSSRLERLKYNTLRASLRNPTVSEPWARAAAHSCDYRGSQAATYGQKAKRHICNSNDYVLMDGRLMKPGSKQTCGRIQGVPDDDEESSEDGDNFSQDVINYTNTWKGLNNDRTVYVATPNGPVPTGGWPCLVFFQFMDKNGVVDESQYSGIGSVVGGVQPASTSNSNYNNIMSVMQQTLDNKIKIICMGQFADDSLFYSGCSYLKAPSSPATLVNNICFNNGDNPDFNILGMIFDDIIQKGNLHLSDINYDKIGLWGYSVGAQMVSRCIQSFPDMKTPSGSPYPSVNYGVMLAGGSYGCYDYGEKALISGKRYQNYMPCRSPINLGCCPHNYAEQRYGQAKYKAPDGTVFDKKAGLELMKNHPPILLLQTTNDSYADPYASTYYYDLVKTGGGQVWKNAYPAKEPKLVSGNLHGLKASQVDPAVRFIRDFSKRVINT